MTGKAHGSLRLVITGDLKSKIDRVWDAFWSGGISNPLEVIEQITYLIFIRRLDAIHSGKEAAARALREPIENPIYFEGEHHLRWRDFKELQPAQMHQRVRDEVFPWLQHLGDRVGDASSTTSSTYAEHMKDARFTITKPALLDTVVDLIDGLPLDRRDLNGDIYEYMVSKIATAGTNGQFRTPRHVIELMVAMTAPKPGDEICDPACGTAGFLVAAAEYLRDRHEGITSDAQQRSHFHNSMFHGYDFDSTMLRIGSMNMLMHGVERPDITYMDSLSEDAAHIEQKFTLILATRPSPAASTLSPPPPTCCATSRRRRPSCFSSPAFCACSRPAAKRPSSFPTACCSGRALRIGSCEPPSSKSTSSPQS